MTSCCWSLCDTETTKMDLVDNIFLISKDGSSSSQLKPFFTECIRINSTTFFFEKNPSMEESNCY